MIEQNIKQTLGDMMVTVITLQTQLAEANKQIEELKAKDVKNNAE